MEDWTEVIITVDAENADAAADIAQMVVPYGIYMEDYSNLEEEAMEIAHIDLIADAVALGIVEHGQRHAILAASCGIEALQLAEQTGRMAAVCAPAQWLQQGGVSDQLRNMIEDHKRLL